MWLTRVPPEMANTGNREETDMNLMPKLNEHCVARSTVTIASSSRVRPW